MALSSGMAQTARVDHAAAMASSSTGNQDDLGRLSTLKFNTRLQDAADENEFDDLPQVDTISGVVADGSQCRIAYRQNVERDGGTYEEQHRLALGDIVEIKVELFESFENEHQGKPGWVYTMTDPPISAVVITHQDGTMDWFAVMGAAAANDLAADIKRGGDYCRRHAMR